MFQRGYHPQRRILFVLSVLLFKVKSQAVPQAASHATIVVPQGLIAFYPMEGNCDDATGNHNARTVDQVDFETRSGKQGKGAHFKGSGHCVADSFKHHPWGSQFSACAWFDRRSLKVGMGIVTTGYQKYGSWGIRVGRMGCASKTCTNLGFSVTTESQTHWDTADMFVTMGEWHHVCMTYNGILLEYYTDGERVASRRTDSGELFTTNKPLFIGARDLAIHANSWGRFVGYMDNVRIYNRAIDSSEVMTIYSFEDGLTFMSLTPECYGGDFYDLYLPNVKDCQQGCAKHWGCKFFSFSYDPDESGSNCYYKSGLGINPQHPCIGCDANGFCGNTGDCDPRSEFCSSNYQAATCNTSTGAACKVCKAQSDRTAHDQCVACNTGYWLNGTSCTAFTCTASFGAACKVCTSQTHRTANDHCAACNTGYKLHGATCKTIDSSAAFTIATTATTTKPVAITTVTAPDATQQVRGNMTLYVLNAAQFVKEKGLESVFQTAVAEIYELNKTWVHHVSVKLSSSRWLGVLKQKLIGLPRFLARATDVDVSWALYIPSDGPRNTMVTVIVDEFNAKAISQVNKEVNDVLSRHRSLSSYAVNVTRKHNIASASSSVLVAQQATKNDNNFMWVIWICIGAFILLLFIAGMRFYPGSWRRKSKQSVSTCSSSASASFPSILNWSAREISGDAVACLARCEFSQFFHPPDVIDENEGERMRKLARAMLSCPPSDCKVGLIYADGRRPADAHGYGPGTFFAVGILKYLYDNNIQCYCDLMIPNEAPVETLRGALFGGRFSACRVVIILQTKALYHARHTLNEIFKACQNKLRLLPLRFEEELVKPGTEWPHVERTSLHEVVMVSEVLQKFCTLNSNPAPPYTIVSQPSVLAKVVADLKSMLGQMELESLPERHSVGVKCLAPQEASTNKTSTPVHPAQTVGHSHTESELESSALGSNVRCAAKSCIGKADSLPASSVLRQACSFASANGDQDAQCFHPSRNTVPVCDGKPGQKKDICKRTNGNDVVLEVPLNSGCTKNQSKDVRSKKLNVDRRRPRAPQDKNGAAETQSGNVAPTGEECMDFYKRTKLKVPSRASKRTKNPIYIAAPGKLSSASKTPTPSGLNSSRKEAMPQSHSSLQTRKEKCKPDCAAATSRHAFIAMTSRTRSSGSARRSGRSTHKSQNSRERNLKLSKSREKHTCAPLKQDASCSSSRKRGHVPCREVELEVITYQKVEE